jgi:hypothetical protein
MFMLMRQGAAGILSLWLVVLSGLVYPQLTSHLDRHAHHNAATHATALCSWLCIAGDAVGTNPVDVAPEQLAGSIPVPPLNNQTFTSSSTQPPVRAPPTLTVA